MTSINNLKRIQGDWDKRVRRKFEELGVIKLVQSMLAEQNLPTAIDVYLKVTRRIDGAQLCSGDFSVAPAQEFLGEEIEMEKRSELFAIIRDQRLQTNKALQDMDPNPRLRRRDTGANIESYLIEAIELANEKNMMIVAEWNGVKFGVTPDMDLEDARGTYSDTLLWAKG